jgi:hypothetical protein
MTERLAALLPAGVLAIFACFGGQSDTKEAAKAIRHVVVHQRPGHFAGWPANNGIWIWQDEILVGFTLGHYKVTGKTHAIDRDRPVRAVLARSLDGGETWNLEDPEHFVGDGGTPVRSPGDVDFTNPNLTIRVGGPPPFHQEGSTFFSSRDRGKTWQGPFLFSGLEKFETTSRTDYLIDGSRGAFLFMSAKQSGIRAGDHQDRAFVARTHDGGKTFAFLSWITREPDTARSVMPSSVRLSKDEIVTALRRRRDGSDGSRNWIDLYASTDNGATWEFRSKVADTGQGNGNPPAMVRMRDARIVVTYGYRSEPYGMRARISRDSGKTWDREIVLREDGATADLGYSRSVQRGDGKVVTIYYYTTEAIPEQHIVATIWDPNAF